MDTSRETDYVYSEGFERFFPTLFDYLEECQRHDEEVENETYYWQGDRVFKCIETKPTIREDYFQYDILYYFMEQCPVEDWDEEDYINRLNGYKELTEGIANLIKEFNEKQTHWYTEQTDKEISTDFIGDEYDYYFEDK